MTTNRTRLGLTVPQTCTICAHPERDAIERATVEGVANRRIAAQYGVTERAVRNHKAKHLPAKLSRAHEAKETAQADDLLLQVRQLRGKSLSILLAAERAGDLRTALKVSPKPEPVSSFWAN